MRTVLGLAAVAVAALVSTATAGDIVLENARLRAVLGDDAAWRSLVDKTTGKEYCPAGKRIAFADAKIGEKTHVANRASLAGDRLTIGLGKCETQLTYVVTKTDDWITFRLESIAGPRPSRLTVVRVGVTITDHVGSLLGGAWNEQYAVCLRGINLQTEGHAGQRADRALLVTAAQDQPGPKLEGSGAALIAAPTAELRSILSKLSVAYDLPRNEANGVPSKDLPVARRSYWFLTFAEKDVDKVIDYCHRTGIRQVLLSSGSWCASVGHHTFNQNYPDGVESLRRTVARLHEQGILVGMHTFASKVSKHDAYVTPVPDRRFCVDMTATLATDVSATATEIRTSTDLSQWPGSPVCKQKVWEGHVSKHQEVIVDDEIIAYQSIGPEGKWDTFLGCRRGALKTRPAAHKPQTECRHYAVDGCINGYILDLDSSLFDETSSRLAAIVNACDFDMVYFDGSEDVDKRRYNYYASKAHGVPMSKFTKRPLVHIGGGFAYGLWHSFTRGGTVDQYPGTYLAYLHDGGTIAKWPTCKDHIDRSVRNVLQCEDNLTTGELGWFGINPKQGKYDGLQYDEIEYLMCKSLGYNAPISLQTSFSAMEAHPLTPDLLELIRAYEEVRSAGQTPATTLGRLREQGKNSVMLRGKLAKKAAGPEFVEVHEMPEVAGTHDLRAFVGSCGSDAVATLWHYTGSDGKLTLSTTSVEACDVQGNPLPVEKTEGTTTLSLDHRRWTLRFPGVSAELAMELLRKGRFEARKPAVLWIEAEAFQTSVGPIGRGSKAKVRDNEAFGDIIVSETADRSGKQPCYCEYRVQIPHKGRWTLWARVRYPTGGDLSFSLVLLDEAGTPLPGRVLGNCGANDKRWHWTGSGGGSTTPPPGRPIVLALKPGEFVFRIAPRETAGSVTANPRLDCLCLAEDPAYVPTDADARASQSRAVPAR
jgi:hypothetical protein